MAGAAGTRFLFNTQAGCKCQNSNNVFAYRTIHASRFDCKQTVYGIERPCTGIRLHTRDKAGWWFYF